MNLDGIAAKAGVSTTCMENLVNNGESSIRLAKRIGTNRANITKFIEGTVSPAIAAALGTNREHAQDLREHAQDLRNKLGRDGAIGLIIGLACGINNSKG